MLYFTESGSTLPNMMAVSKEFDQTYDENEYEGKIGQVIRRIHDQPSTDHEKMRWIEAVRRLRLEDHYLLVLIDAASRRPTKRSGVEIIRLIVAGLVIVAVFLPILSFLKSHVSDQAVFNWISDGLLLALVILAVLIGNRKQ